MFIRTVEIPVYYVDVIIVIYDDFLAVDKKYKLKLKEAFAPEDANDCHAVTHLHPDYVDKNEIYVLFKPQHLNIDTFSHELIHVIGYICSTRGIFMDCDNDEPMAYLQGYISGELAQAVVTYMDANKMDLRQFLLPNK